MSKGFQLSAPPSESFYSSSIFLKLYDFYKELHTAIAKFPRQQRYSLGQKLDTIALELMELLIGAAKYKSTQKLITLEKATIKLDLLKMLIRLARDTQSLDTKKYLQLEEQLQEIGRMLGGWLKNSKLRA